MVSVELVHGAKGEGGLGLEQLPAKALVHEEARVHGLALRVVASSSRGAYLASMAGMQVETTVMYRTVAGSSSGHVGW